MKAFYHNLLLLICLAVPIAGIAQTGLPDSLQQAVDNPALNEKDKPALLNQLAEIYRINRDYPKAEARARQGIAIALRYKNYLDVTRAYTLLVNINAGAREYKSMAPAGDTALLMAAKANSPVAMAYAFYAKVLLYKTLDDAGEMVRFCDLGLKQLEKTSDPFIAAKIYYQLYAVHSKWNNEAKVNAYARKATENALLTKDYNLLNNCYTALSVAHEYNYNTSKNHAELDSMLFYLRKSEMLYAQYPGLVADYTEAITCINLADYYQRYAAETDVAAREQGIHYANAARKFSGNVGLGQEVVASSLGILSEYAKREGNNAQSEKYLLEAYEVMKTGPLPYYHTMINVVEALAGVYEQQGDYKKALGFQKLVTQYTNKNFNEQQALHAQKLEIQYETEKKDNEMRVLKEREHSRRLQNYLYACITVATLLLLLFLVRSYYFKLRYARQREKQLELEKQDAALQIKLQKEEQARLKAEQQLLKAQQQQLKKEAMANVLQLEHKNQTLHQIREKLTAEGPVNMQKILKEEMALDNDFEQAKLQIQQVHPGFFNLLNDKAGKKLSLLDLKLCAYLYLQMDTRQISQLMNIEAKSVRMSKYRIKQKLGLEKEDDLRVFLQGIAG